MKITRHPGANIGKSYGIEGQQGAISYEGLALLLHSSGGLNSEEKIGEINLGTNYIYYSIEGVSKINTK